MGIAIRPLAAGEVEQLVRAPWSSGLPEKHARRFARQAAGEADYLVAWDGATPIGHLLVKWTGPGQEPMDSRLADCAAIEDFVIAPALRSRGYGRLLLDEAARRARERGLRRLGLAVGLDNPRARALYERVGFAETDCGVITIRWQYLGSDGRRHWASERCVYLTRELG